MDSATQVNVILNYYGRLASNLRLAKMTIFKSGKLLSFDLILETSNQIKMSQDR